MLVLKNIHKRYGIRRVLEGVSFSVGEGQHVAIVGGNGTGKSTLLKIIAGEETFERGTRTIPNRILIGYLPQETPVFSEESIQEYLERQSGLALQKKIMAQSEDKLDDPHHAERYAEAQFMYERLGGDLFSKRAHKFLKGLCLTGIGMERRANTLSGGQKRKLALTAVLLQGVDMLVLDEPTNNLDLPALQFLENYLKKSKATIIMASHDRYFMNVIVQKIFEINWYSRTVQSFTGNWNEYTSLKRHLFRRKKELWREQESERKRLEDSGDQKKAWVERIKDLKAPDSDKMAAHFKRERATKKFNASAKAIESRLKRLDEHDEPLEKKPPTILLPHPEKFGSLDLELTQAVIGYAGEGNFQSEPLSLYIPYGTRLGILGENGTGKTTLLKTITGDIPPMSGERKISDDVRFGYFLQEHDTLDASKKVFEYLQSLDVLSLTKDKALFELSNFGLAPDVMDDKLCNLSPGERVRVILAGLVLLGANTLILDEPTNHLDLDAIEALEDALLTFPGTLLVVTHDRQFKENLELTESFSL